MAATVTIRAIGLMQLERRIKAIPAKANGEVNVGMQAIGTNYFRRFNSQLGIKVRRKRAKAQSSGKRGRPRPRIPGRLRDLGFRGTIGPRGRIDGKTLTMTSRSGHAESHEFPTTIRPKKTSSGKGRKFLTLIRKSGRGKKGIFALVPFVRTKARLGFYKTWRSSSSDVTTATDRMAKRLERLL